MLITPSQLPNQHKAYFTATIHCNLFHYKQCATKKHLKEHSLKQRNVQYFHQQGIIKNQTSL